MEVKTIKKPINRKTPPSILLIGNGISISAGRSTKWDELIQKFLVKNNVDIPFSEIKDMPANMQIVVATKNNVKSELQTLKSSMVSPVSSSVADYLKSIVDLPVDAVLNTNYDYDIEQALGVKPGIGAFEKCRKWTKDIKKGTNDKKYNLFQFSDLSLNGIDKPLWHIHGDICSPGNMIMGHSYYGSLLHQIQNYMPDFFRQYNLSKKRGCNYYPRSWVDYFLSSNVYILGFGLYTTETDLWWLIDKKREHFQNTNIYFYTSENTETETTILLKTYGAEVINTVQFKGNYKEYYLNAIQDINKRITESIASNSNSY